jgi:peptidyl-prolyl cis-trans isomerase C
MSLKARFGAAASALALSLAAGAVAVHAQDATESSQMEAAALAVDPATVVARVGDKEITEQDVQFANEAFGNELANVPPDQTRKVTIEALINLELAAQAARDAGLDQTEKFAHRLDFLTTQALRNAFIATIIDEGVSDDAMQAGYEELVVTPFEPTEEIHARHILVENKEDAEAIIEQLQDGASFEELAKQSKDPTGENGGDLGFFSSGQMVKPFEEAAFALEPGEITEEPVETEFGWHVIKLEEKRMSEPPSLSDVEPQLRDFLMRRKLEDKLAELRAQMDVEIIEEEPEESPDASDMSEDSQPADGTESSDSGDAEAGNGSQN